MQDGCERRMIVWGLVVGCPKAQTSRQAANPVGMCDQRFSRMEALVTVWALREAATVILAGGRQVLQVLLGMNL